jgi:hypothetical protein
VGQSGALAQGVGDAGSSSFSGVSDPARPYDGGNLPTKHPGVDRFPQDPRERCLSEGLLLEVRVPAHGDHRQRPVASLHLVQQPEAIMPRHRDVGDHDIHLTNVGQRLIGRARCDDEGARMLKSLFQHIATVVVIFNDEHTDTGQVIEVVQSRHRGRVISFLGRGAIPRCTEAAPRTQDERLFPMSRGSPPWASGRLLHQHEARTLREGRAIHEPPGCGSSPSHP